MYRRLTTLALFQTALIIALILVPQPPKTPVTGTNAALNAKITPSVQPNQTIRKLNINAELPVSQNQIPATPPTPDTTTPDTSIPDNTTPDTRCIILIDGRKYDVTSFRSKHSGGDIFQCGTDMSAVFHGRHAQSYLEMMAQYAL